MAGSLRHVEFHPGVAQQGRKGIGGRASVKSRSICARVATCTMAGRSNLLWSVASHTSRAWAMMVCATFTSRRSKSRSEPSGSMPEMPMSAMSTLNWRMKSTAASPTMPRSRARTTPPATITSQSGLPARIAATFRLFVITRSPPVVQQRPRDRLGGGADVQDQRAVVRHCLGHGPGDARLAFGMQGFHAGCGPGSPWWSWAPARRRGSAAANRCRRASGCRGARSAGSRPAYPQAVRPWPSGGRGLLREAGAVGDWCSREG